MVMEVTCEYDGCDMKLKGETTDQSIDLLKIHIGVKHHRASEGQGGRRRIHQKENGLTEDLRRGDRGKMENIFEQMETV